MKRWDAFWFGPMDPRQPALLRMGWALAALWCVVPWWQDLAWLFTEAGPNPAVVARQDGLLPYRLLANDVWVIESLSVVQGLWGLMVAGLVCTALGLGGRIPVLIAWLLFISFAARCPGMTYGSHNLIRVFGFYLLLMPVTATWSLDARLGRVQKPASRWPLQLWRLNVCLVYLSTAIAKLWFEDWRIGDAVAYTWAPNALSRFSLEPLLSLAIVPWLGKLATWGTVAFELGFPLVWHPRLRKAVLIGGIVMHLGISVLLCVGHFTTSILMTYLAFVELPRREPRGAAGS